MISGCRAIILYVLYHVNLSRIKEESMTWSMPKNTISVKIFENIEQG